MDEYTLGAQRARGIGALPEMPPEVRAAYETWRGGGGSLPDVVTEWLDAHGVHADEDTETDQFRDGFWSEVWEALARRYG